MSIYNITQLRCMFKATNMGNMNYILTFAPNYHTKLTNHATCKQRKCHEIANIKLCSLTSIRLSSPIAINWMPPKGLAKANNLVVTKEPWDMTCNYMRAHLKKLFKCFFINLFTLVPNLQGIMLLLNIIIQNYIENYSRWQKFTLRAMVLRIYIIYL